MVQGLGFWLKLSRVLFGREGLMLATSRMPSDTAMVYLGFVCVQQGIALAVYASSLPGYHETRNAKEE